MSDQWSALAEEIAGHAQDYVDGLTRVAGGEGGDAIWSLLLVEVAQVSLAGAKLGPTATSSSRATTSRP